MKEIKVKLYRTMDDCYVELWKAVGERSKFYARYVYGRPMWYFVSDPLGYCELDHACPDDYIFEVCDQSGNVLFTDSNGAENHHPFMTLEQKTKQVWLSIKDKHKTCDGLNDWLLSYMTKKNLDKDPDTTQFCPADNWTACWYDRIGHGSVFDYEYLGEKYCIWAITCKHRYCDCVWIEYMAGEKNMDWEYPCFVKYFGSWFNPIYGPMYSKRKACEYMMDALVQIYGDVNHLSYVSRDLWGDYHEHRLNLYNAAAYLIGKDLSRDHVQAVAKTEREKHTLYTSYEAIKADYPDCKRDFSLSWG